MVWFLLAGAVVAQGTFADSLAGESGGGRIVVAIQEALSGEGLDANVVEAVESITGELFMSVMESGASATANSDALCAYLVGTGGTIPRLDGGGEWLSIRPTGVDGTDIQRSLHTAMTIREDVRLVIMDTFDLGGIRSAIEDALGAEGLDVHAVSEDADLWSALVGNAFAELGGSDTPDNSVPHGHVVAFHALSQLPQGSRITDVREEAGYVVFEVSLPPSGDGPTPSMVMRLVHIDFNEIETIKMAMVQIRGTDSNAVVMSWGIVDCFVKNGYEASDAPDTLAEYVAESLSGRPELEALVRGLCEALDVVREELGGACDDFETTAVLGPLAYFAGLNDRSERDLGHSDDSEIRFFAAAGNQGLGFPMPPAAWLGIHAVEACVLIDGLPEVAAFSNHGTLAEGDDAVPVQALGAWFETVERDGDLVLGYWGTSFAAPAAAVRYFESGIQEKYAPCDPAE